MRLYVVCLGHGYYANSIWTTREAAIAECKRLGEWDPSDPLRGVQEWEVDKRSQHFAEANRADEMESPR